MQDVSREIEKEYQRCRKKNFGVKELDQGESLSQIPMVGWSYNLVREYITEHKLEKNG